VGHRRASFAPCTRSTRCGWTGSTSLCPLAGQRVLDVGCGGGILTDAMARKGANVTGHRLVHQAAQGGAIACAGGAVPRTCKYREVSAEALAAEMPGQFDVVTCMEMLEHVPDPASVVQACATLVKPGGWVFFSTLNRNPKSFLFAIVGAEYVLNLLPRGTHEYAKFIRPSRTGCRFAAQRAGLAASPRAWNTTP